jgi:UPF0042 nucleotide-binding protein
MHLVLISGVSGSGKSVAIRTLEDCGFHCVDNLLVSFIPQAVSDYQRLGFKKIAISVDVRSGASIQNVPTLVTQLKAMESIKLAVLFLDARTTTLLRRYSETRRIHPLSDPSRSLQDCILLERDMLQNITDLSYCLDTTELSARTLQLWIREWVAHHQHNRTQLVLESFGYKYGVPRTSDFVFDLRCLPNPYYHEHLRHATGQDKIIEDYFRQEPLVLDMKNDLIRMITKWFLMFEQHGRAYVTIALGCTGGQHRSVFMVEELSKYFSGVSYPVLTLHRQLLSKINS